MTNREKMLKKHLEDCKKMYETLGNEHKFKELMLYLRPEILQDILKYIIDNVLSYQEWCNLKEMVEYHYINNSTLIAEKYDFYQKEKEADAKE